MILAQTVHEVQYKAAKPSDAAFSTVLNFDNFQPEVRSNGISGAVVDPAGVKAHVKFGDSRSNRSRDIRLPYFITNDNDDDAGVRAKRR